MKRPTATLPSPSRGALVQAVAIACSAFAHKQHIATELRGWRDSKDAEQIIIRAATAPASMTQSAWADTLAQTTVWDFISVLGPASAGSALLKRGLVLRFNGAAQIVVPSITATASNTSFVQEAAPIPHRQLSFTGPSLSPRKFATLTTFTRESFEHSSPTIESLVRTTLTESVGHALDAAMFSATVGDSVRPPGLLVGVSALTPSANADRNQAAIEDAATLAAAVSTVAANGEIVFICSPKQAVTLRLRTIGFPYLVLASSALADKTVICVAANCIASATDPRPRFDISDQGTEHLDTVPQAIGTSPNVVAATTISLFQSDMLSLKMVFEMSWCLRHASGLAWMQNVVW